MVNGKRNGCRSGFSLIELFVVVTFIAIVVMMAIPSLYLLAPNYMVRSSSSGWAMLMQRARLAANNTQKPTRVVMDCRAASQTSGRSSCLMFMSSANYDSAGDLDSTEPWKMVRDSRREVDKKVKVAIPNKPGDPRAVPSPVYENIADLYWAVFMPTGRAHVSHDPMRLRFSAAHGDIRPREVSLNPYSGRATVRATP